MVTSTNHSAAILNREKILGYLCVICKQKNKQNYLLYPILLTTEKILHYSTNMPSYKITGSQYIG